MPRTTGAPATCSSNSNPWILTGGGPSTYNTAFGNIEAKADFVQVDGGSSSSPQMAVSSGRYIVNRSHGTLLEMQFYGGNAENLTGSARIWGWSQIINGLDQQIIQWHPTLLAIVSLTTGLEPGIASGLVTASQYYCDTLSVTSDRTLGPNGARVLAPTGAADQGVVTLVVDPMAHDVVEIEVTRNGGTMTSIGVLHRWTSGV